MMERVRDIGKHVFSFIKDPSELYIRIARAFVHLVYDVEYKGTENVPEKGGAILICNHVSFMDGVIINAGFNRRIRYIIDEGLYNLPILNYFMRLNRAVPIAPNRASVSRALDEVSEGLKNGDIFCIFPEGQITYTGNLSRFRSGTEWMLKRCPVPVVPMALKGLWGTVLSRKYKGSLFRYIPRSLRRKVTLRVGPVIMGEITASHMQRIIMRLMNIPD